jgi:VCBS repeat-containing protein
MFKLFQKKKDAAATSQSNKKNPPSSSSVKRSLLSLEPRLMFDAAAAATASEVASEQVAQEQAEAAVSSDSAADSGTTDQVESQGVLDAIATYNPGESRTEVVFVDPAVPNYQELLGGMDPNIEVIMLDERQDGVEQMATTLSGRSGIDAIHLISHGSAGQLQLGTGTLNADSMSSQYEDELATIQQSLSEQADILVYGCDFAEGDTGQAAVNLLAELTGADVQASTDLTGNISLGGDWDFEVSTGTIETALAIDYDAQMNWAGVLGTETVTDTFSEKSFGNNDGTRSWSSNWSEVDVGKSDAKGGHIQVNSGELRIQTQMVGASVSRGVDLSRVNSATLSFDYKNDIDKGGSVEIRISTDGGQSYKTLDSGTFSSSDNTGNGTAKFDISSYASADTKIQFVVTGTSGGDRLLVDNVQISYDAAVVNQAPTDLALSANTVAENATSGTVVGTISATDPDAGDTKTYSLTDTAGGRFAIDAITGVLTVADGSLLNYESAASHTVTVRVTDSGGQSVDKTFTIGVDNMPEPLVVGGVEPTPTVDPVTPEPVMVAADPVVDVSAGPAPVVELVTPESVVEVAVDPAPVVESVSPAVMMSGTEAGSESEGSAISDSRVLSESHDDADTTDPITEVMTIADHAETGMVVGMAGGTDPDTADTNTYSLTDTAGDRFAIDPTSGLIIVADGSLQNHEAQASHTITVQVTDGEGKTLERPITIHLTSVKEGPVIQEANGNRDDSFVGSLFGNTGGLQSGAGKSLGSVGESARGDPDSVSILPNDSHHTVEWNTESVPRGETGSMGRNAAPSIQEEVVIHEKEHKQTSVTRGIKGMPEDLSSEKAQAEPRPEVGPWTWSQSDESESEQAGSAELGLSMAVGLAGLAGQGRQGTKEKMMSVKAQLQALHRKNPSENTSQRADENAKKESVPEG